MSSSSHTSANPPSDKNHWVWVDMEMTGLLPQQDRILEIAMIITDADLNIIATQPGIAVHQSTATLEGMDKWNQSTHTKSGLIERVKQSPFSERDVELQSLAFMQKYVAQHSSPMCGNSICQDRRFMAQYMPELEDWFHYRNLDVSTLKELCRHWRPDLSRGVKKHGRHEALADIEESIAEMRYYRENFIREKG